MPERTDSFYPQDPDGLFRKAAALMERIYGFKQFRDGQEEILRSVLDGSDTLIIMPTGGGKSLCYQLPAFVRPGTTLVISPLISLMKDQVDGLRVLDLPAVAVHSLMSRAEQEEVLGRIASGNVKLVYTSPERLRNPRFLQALKAVRISMAALDEAHCISQWGHDFRPDYLKVQNALHALGRPQTIALTATATEKVRDDILRHLRMRSPRVFITGFDRRNLYWEVAPVRTDREKMEVIEESLRAVSGAAIIYAGTRNEVERVADACRKSGIQADAYHAGMEKGERTRVQEGFMEGRTDLVVATNAFGMGIDRADIRMVIHHTFPGSIEAYYQESGRAGRDGDPAKCLLLYSPSDRRLHEFFIEMRYPSRKTVLAVYERLCTRPEDLLWLTYRDIGMMGNEKIQDMAVASSIRILEETGSVMRLHHMDNLAELYFRKSPLELLKGLPQRARARRELLLSVCRIYGEDELTEGIRFLPEELAEKTACPLDSLKRMLSEMTARNEADYIPPFRGRGIRILKRVKPEELAIDFDALKLRTANDQEKLDQVVAYAAGGSCRRGFLLRYFGEDTPMDRCGACDQCRRAREEEEGPGEERAEPILAVKVLSGVARLKGRFGLKTAAKVLLGSKDRMILGFGLHRLSTYGLLSEFTMDRIQEWLRELHSLGCLSQVRISTDKKTYPVLELTERGRRVMAGKEEVRLRAPKEAKTQAAPRPEVSGDGKGKEVFQRLRDLRLTIAKAQGLPPYCIFHDRTLKEMAGRLPADAAALLDIPGVGEITFRKYGAAFLELLRKIRAEEQGDT